MTGPLLLLSHAGADSEAAKQLAAQIEATPAARDLGLKVWIDKNDLRAGQDWQEQLEEVIEKHSTACGAPKSCRIINWVEREVRLALTRVVCNGKVR
jgi:hypothetical protein